MSLHTVCSSCPRLANLQEFTTPVYYPRICFDLH
nr:MAG TPA: hypothetical protein [Bacteriophage sp.]